MITHIHLKAGSSPRQPPLVVETPPSVTIFVGPNNSGKSLALREIHLFCNVDEAQSFVIGSLDFEGRGDSDARRELESLKAAPLAGERTIPEQSIVTIGQNRFLVAEAQFLDALIHPNSRKHLFADWYLRHFVLNLDGPSRVSLVNSQGRGDLKNPTTPLARLLTNDSEREALRKVIYESLGLHFAIDAQAGDQLSIRFGSTPPPDERSFNDQALEYMRSASGIESVSDGVKAFTGILIQLHTGDPKIILIDEPEAFLHPSLVSRLAMEIARGAISEHKRVFVATHSPQFVMGAVLSGARVNIVRLTYERGVATARLLPSAELTQLMQDPLLRSAGVLSGLFYKHVVVCEADADRAFYQEVNERLLATNDSRGAPDTLFLNADNKQTIPRIVEPLRKLGIPTAAIADLDILKGGGQEWTRHLIASGIPTSDHQPFGARRANALKAL